MSIDDKQLGRLERVTLRDVWADEAGDFTPWLATKDNLTLLGGVIGLDLELEAQEKNVGPFRADILCRDTVTSNFVLIENQLERTDHGHLGQLLTYAAGLDAVTIVWISQRFTDEHRAALDWLNKKTDEQVNFFGLEIELWRIGGSQVAPKFNVVSSPNDWTRAMTETRKSGLTDTQLLQLEYWAGLQEMLTERDGPIKARKPLACHWAAFALGRSNFEILALVNTQKRDIQIQLSCLGPDSTAHYHLLEQQKEAIEEELALSLEWVDMPDSKRSRINLRHPEFDPIDRESWPAQHQWFVEILEAFHRVFAPRIKELNAEDYVVPEQE